jgi:hypothetical protein
MEHQFLYPKVTPLPKPSPSVHPDPRGRSQRDRVLASLVACPRPGAATAPRTQP